MSTVPENERTKPCSASKDLLVAFTPYDGWSPLCSFLDVPKPKAPVESGNAWDEFWARFGINRA